MHGWAISERIQQISRDVLQVNQGSLYPALHRLEHRAGSRPSGDLRTWPACTFLFTHNLGRKQLEIEAENWNTLTDAIARC